MQWGPRAPRFEPKRRSRPVASAPRIIIVVSVCIDCLVFLRFYDIVLWVPGFCCCFFNVVVMLPSFFYTRATSLEAETIAFIPSIAWCSGSLNRGRNHRKSPVTKTDMWTLWGSRFAKRGQWAGRNWPSQSWQAVEKTPECWFKSVIYHNRGVSKWVLLVVVFKYLRASKKPRFVTPGHCTVMLQQENPPNSQTSCFKPPNAPTAMPSLKDLTKHLPSNKMEPLNS